MSLAGMENVSMATSTKPSQTTDSYVEYSPAKHLLPGALTGLLLGLVVGLTPMTLFYIWWRRRRPLPKPQSAVGMAIRYPGDVASEGSGDDWDDSSWDDVDETGNKGGTLSTVVTTTQISPPEDSTGAPPYQTNVYEAFITKPTSLAVVNNCLILGPVGRGNGTRSHEAKAPGLGGDTPEPVGREASDRATRCDDVMASTDTSSHGENRPDYINCHDLRQGEQGKADKARQSVDMTEYQTRDNLDYSVRMDLTSECGDNSYVNISERRPGCDDAMVQKPTNHDVSYVNLPTIVVPLSAESDPETAEQGPGRASDSTPQSATRRRPASLSGTTAFGIPHTEAHRVGTHRKSASFVGGSIDLDDQAVVTPTSEADAPSNLPSPSSESDKLITGAANGSPTGVHKGHVPQAANSLLLSSGRAVKAMDTLDISVGRRTQDVKDEPVYVNIGRSQPRDAASK